MNKGLATIKLKPGRDASVRRFHPWVFSGGAHKPDQSLAPGDIVRVVSDSNQTLGMGHFLGGSIIVKMLAFEECRIDSEFWRRRISEAAALRDRLGLLHSTETNCFRLVNAEGDGLPGLIVDIYGDTAVIQAQSEGMEAARDEVAGALAEVLKSRIKNIFFKPHGKAQGDAAGQYLLGSKSEALAVENGRRFFVDWEKGQKTGFFLDQRDNRRLISELSSGARVLNLFSYTGGFSIYALTAGAVEVDSVDSSKPAVQILDQNAALNNVSDRHHSHAVDCFTFLENASAAYDIVIVDPPAFVKHKDSIKSGLKGYTEINALALRALKPDGLFFTFSCSQLVDEEAFLRAVSIAGQQSGRTMRKIYSLRSAPCHAVSLYHPEGHYLKGFGFYAG